VFHGSSQKWQNPEHNPVQKVGSPDRVVHHALAINLDFHLGDLVRADHVARGQIRGADHTADRNQLMLGVDLDFLGPFDHKVAVGQNVGDASAQCGAQ
jgi:hypothetical protein